MTVQPFFAASTIGQNLIQAEVNRVHLTNFAMTLPSKQHILELLVVLEGICQFQHNPTKPLAIDYSVFKTLAKTSTVHEHLREKFLKANVFLRLPKILDTSDVSIAILMSYICKCITYQGLYCSLSEFSVGDPGSEYITSLDSLEDWLYVMSSRLNQVQKMTEQFLPLWVFTAAHTIAFFHGKQVTNRVTFSAPGSSRTSTVSLRINIPDLIQSNTMKQLLDMRNSIVEDMDNNLFARIRAVRYYDSFTVFDSMRFDDNDPMVPPTESCCIFAGGYMNPVFVNRILGIYLGGPPIDYRRFLTFAIAWENRRTEAGIRYFWPVIDITHKGYIDIDDMYPLVDGMVTILQSLPASCGPQGGSARTILLDEISDILSSGGGKRGVFTLARALECPGAFGTIIGLLGNTQSFVEYECREDTAHKQFMAKQMKEAKLNQQVTNRATELARLQKVIDDTWFENSSNRPSPAFASFVEFLDHHEQVYGGQAMEPWLTQYYQWEAQEAETCQLMMDSQLGPVDESLIDQAESLRSRE